MFVKILKPIDGLEVGKVYEADDASTLTIEDAQGHIDAGNAEAIDVTEVKDADIGSAIAEGIDSSVKAAMADGFKALAAKNKSSIIVVGDAVDADPGAGYQHAGQYLKDVRTAGNTGRVPERLAKAQAICLAQLKVAGHMAEGDDSQGGFLVPTAFDATLRLNRILETGIAGRCTRIPMATNSVSLPYINETTQAASVYGGLTVYRTGEAALKNPSKPTFGLCTLTLHKTTAVTYVSDELLEDSAISISPLIGTLFPDALQFVLEDDLLNGTGAGQGLGVIPAPATITVARAGAGAIARADILNMYRRMYPRSLPNAEWYANIDTMAQFQTMTQVVGTGGVATYIPPATLDSGAPYGMLHGRKINFITLAQTLGTAGDVIFADMSQMLLGQKAGGMTGLESSIHYRFVWDETTFKMELRSDNQPWWPAPLTPRYSAETLSPFVILGDAAATTTT